MRILSIIIAVVLFSSPLHAELALKKVLLSTGGVGHFEYEAEVQGDETLELSVPLNQVDDVLKSITVYDNQGTVKSVSLAGKQPLSEMFKNLPFEQSSFNSFDRLLNDLQGAMITVKGQKRVAGRIVNVVSEIITNDDVSTTRHRVSVMTDSGVEQFILEDTEEVKFLDKKLNTQIQKALVEITNNKAKDSRDIKIELAGDKKRKIRVSYIAEVPLWKTSYRLVIAEDNKDKLLQGWAVLENMSGQDWDNISLSLISGNPVTFKQPLYTSYYVPRPEIPVSIGGRIMPKVDEGGVAKFDDANLRGLPVAQKPMAMKSKSMSMERISVGVASLEDEMLAEADMAYAPPPAIANMQQAVTTEKASASVVFNFPQKISVKSGHSLVVPIINESIEMERVALYQPSTHETHPLASVEVKNTAKTDLPQGILTIYESGKNGMNYVGDSQLANFPEGEKRLLSFAMDNDITIDKKTDFKERIFEGKINKGIFYAKKKQQETTTYLVKAPKKEQSLIVEYPRKSGWEIVSPKDVEITKDNYRIKQKISGEKKFDIISERVIDEQISLVNLNVNMLNYYIKEGELSKETKQVFQKIAEFMDKKTDYQNQINLLEGKKRNIVDGQSRIRQNLQTASSSNSLKNRYLKKLEEQEDEIEKIESDIEKHIVAKQELERRLSDYIAGL